MLEEWMMNWNDIVPGVVAVILAIGSIVLFLKSQRGIGTDINNSRLELSKEHADISKKHKDLSAEHKDLSAEHKDLSSEHKDLSAEHRIIFERNDVLSKGQSEIKSMVQFLRDEQLRNDGVRQQLSRKELDVLDITEYLNAFKDVMLKQKEEIKYLRNENRKLKEKLQSMEMNKQRAEEKTMNSFLDQEEDHERNFSI